MKVVSKSKNKWFFWSMVVSLLFIAGTVGVPLFAVSGNFVLMGICIAAMVFAFFALPFFWVAFATRASILRTCIAIEQEHIYSVDQLARHLAKQSDVIVNHINKLIAWCAIDYQFDGQQLFLGGVNLKEQKWTQKCPSCGANISGEGFEGECQYCGWIENKN
ncbi:MAG: hypothetical protein E7344_00630 [Clostridiales bacterium]|nr:hypothetical protein [Clostridiales bacterium]